MRKFILICIFSLLPFSSFAGYLESCNDSVKIRFVSPARVDVFVKLEGKFKKILEDSRAYVACHKKNLIEITYSCGSPCNYTAFYDPTKQKISKFYYFVLDTHIESEQIAIQASNGKYQLEIKKIFSDSIGHIIKRKFSNAAILGNVVTVKFINSNTIDLTYMTGSKYDEVNEIVKLK